MFPQCHTDNSRKQTPLFSLEPLAPLITLPKFSSGSSRCSFNLCHSCCLPFHHSSTEQQAQTQSRKFGRGTAGVQWKAQHCWKQGLDSRQSAQDAGCSKTRRVSIRELSSLKALMHLDSEAAGFTVTGVCATQPAFRLDGSARIEIFIFTFLLSPPVSPHAQSPQSGHQQGHTGKAGSSWRIPLHHCNYKTEIKTKGVQETILTCEMLYRHKCNNNLILKGPLNSQNEKAKPLMTTSEEHMRVNADKPYH